jgi:hypothetical protein
VGQRVVPGPAALTAFGGRVRVQRVTEPTQGHGDELGEPAPRAQPSSHGQQEQQAAASRREEQPAAVVNL